MDCRVDLLCYTIIYQPYLLCSLCANGHAHPFFHETRIFRDGLSHLSETVFFHLYACLYDDRNPVLSRQKICLCSVWVSLYHDLLNPKSKQYKSK